VPGDRALDDAGELVGGNRKLGNPDDESSHLSSSRMWAMSTWDSTTRVV
jgi:hypothetical protein